MNQPTDKHREEARKLSHAMTLEGVRWRRKNFWANEGQTTRDFDFLLSLLSSRDAEIREVLEGLRDDDCFDACFLRWMKRYEDSDGFEHSDACLAARGLWSRLQS